ncbi:hypothetical protein D3C73_899270 [compost metagenome]
MQDNRVFRDCQQVLLLPCGSLLDQHIHTHAGFQPQILIEQLDSRFNHPFFGIKKVGHLINIAFKIFAFIGQGCDPHMSAIFDKG